MQAKTVRRTPLFNIYLIHVLCSLFFALLCTLKKKLTENSASLTGCNRLTCKGDGKLFRHEDRVNPTSSDDEDGIFRNHRKFPMVFCFPAKEFSDNFPSTFQLSESSKVAPAGLDPTTFRITIHYSTTAPQSLYMNLRDGTKFYFPQYL